MRCKQSIAATKRNVASFVRVNSTRILRLGLSLSSRRLIASIRELKSYDTAIPIGLHYATICYIITLFNLFD